MAEIAIPLGKEARLYYGAPNSAVTCNASAAVLEAAGLEVQGIRDATVVIEKEDTDASRRRSHGWGDTREAIKQLNITFDMPNTFDAGVEQAAIATLRKTFGNGTYDGLQVVSGICLYALSSKSAAIADEPGPQSPDGEGICADFILLRFERAEPFGDVQMYSVEAKMTQIHGRIPAWV